MPKEPNEIYKSDHQFNADLIRLVGRLPLTSNASIDDHFLTSISILNRQYGGPVPEVFIEQIILKAISHNLWTNEEAEIWREPLIQPDIHPAKFHRLFIAVVTDLTILGELELDSCNLSLTERGIKTLSQVVLPENI
jgi:hypothetical protein